MQLLVWEILLQLQLEEVAAAKSAWLSAAADVFAADAAAAGVIVAAGDWVEGEWLLEAWVHCLRVA